jgi:hypothetical protein
MATSEDINLAIDITSSTCLVDGLLSIAEA